MGDSRSIRWIDVTRVYVNPKKLRNLSQAKIRQYAEAYERGDSFPPLKVNDCGDFYTVRDGRHRLQAQLFIGTTMVEVEV